MSAGHSPLRSLLAILALGVTGGLVLPIGSYVAGKRWVGPYEGKLGLSDYLSAVYGAAGRGEILAWWLLLSPVLIAIVWYGVARLLGRLDRPPDRQDA